MQPDVIAIVERRLRIRPQLYKAEGHLGDVVVFVDPQKVCTLPFRKRAAASSSSSSEPRTVAVIDNYGDMG